MSLIASEIVVEIAYALPREQVILSIKGKEDLTIEQAIITSGILNRYTEIDLRINQVGIFGKLSTLDSVLRHQDRVEIYRPLLNDPTVARKLRASNRDGVKRKLNTDNR